jgi:hypothetical protein
MPETHIYIRKFCTNYVITDKTTKTDENTKMADTGFVPQMCENGSVGLNRDVDFACGNNQV